MMDNTEEVGSYTTKTVTNEGFLDYLDEIPASFSNGEYACQFDCKHELPVMDNAPILEVEYPKGYPSSSGRTEGHSPSDERRRMRRGGVMGSEHIHDPFHELRSVLNEDEVRNWRETGLPPRSPTSKKDTCSLWSTSEPVDIILAPEELSAWRKTGRPVTKRFMMTVAADEVEAAESYTGSFLTPLSLHRFETPLHVAEFSKHCTSGSEIATQPWSSGSNSMSKTKLDSHGLLVLSVLKSSLESCNGGVVILTNTQNNNGRRNKKAAQACGALTTSRGAALQCNYVMY